MYKSIIRPCFSESTSTEVDLDMLRFNPQMRAAYVTWGGPKKYWWLYISKFQKTFRILFLEVPANKMREVRFWKFPYGEYIRACRKNAFFVLHRNRHREYVFRNQRAKWRRMVVELSRFDRFLIFYFFLHFWKIGDKKWHIELLSRKPLKFESISAFAWHD